MKQLEMRIPCLLSWNLPWQVGPWEDSWLQWLHATVDGRNPFRTTLKPRGTITIACYFQGNHDSKAVDTIIYRGIMIQGFLNGGAISGFRNHPQYGSLNQYPTSQLKA